MQTRYTAKFYLGNKLILEQSSDHVDELYHWLLSTAQGKLGDIKGEIIDNKTQEIIKRLKKIPAE